MTLELVTVIGSDLTDLDEYIKEYLLDPDLLSISKIKICLYYYITEQPELILQLQTLEDHLEKANSFLFRDVFGKHRIDRKIC